MKSNPAIPSFIGLRKLAVSAACYLTLSLGLRANDPVPINSETIDLKPFEVKAKRQLPKFELLWAFGKKDWQYAQIEDFEVLSYAWEGRSKNYLRDFQRFRDALSVAWPIPLQPLAQNTIILCGADNIYDLFAPLGEGSDESVFSHLFYDAEKSTIVVNLQKSFYDTELRDQFVRFEIDHRRELYRQYARLIYRQSSTPPPPWLIEGNIQIIMDMKFYDRVIHYGKLDFARGRPSPDDIPFSAQGLLEEVASFDPTVSYDENFNEIGETELAVDDPYISSERLEEGALVTIESILPFWKADPPFHIALSNQALMPMEEMFAFTHEQYSELNPLTDIAWAKQAHAFIHYCKFGASRKYEAPFQTFVQRIAREPLTEQLFIECFGLNYDEMLNKVRSHIRAPYHSYDYYKLRKNQGISAEKVRFREPSPNEVGRIVGSAQLAAGRVEEALHTFQEAIKRLEPLTESPSPELLTFLAQANLQMDMGSLARERLEIAAHNGSAMPSTWTTLARTRLDDLKALYGPNSLLDPEPLAKVLLPLLMARKLEPAIPETYELMTEAWQRSAIPPNLVQVDLLSEGVSKFPYNTDLGLEVAKFYLQAHSPENAWKCARFSLQHCPDPSQRAKLLNFIQTLETASKPEDKKPQTAES